MLLHLARLDQPSTTTLAAATAPGRARDAARPARRPGPRRARRWRPSRPAPPRPGVGVEPAEHADHLLVQRAEVPERGRERVPPTHGRGGGRSCLRPPGWPRATTRRTAWRPRHPGRHPRAAVGDHRPQPRPRRRRREHRHDAGEEERRQLPGRRRTAPTRRRSATISRRPSHGGSAVGRTSSSPDDPHQHRGADLEGARVDHARTGQRHRRARHRHAHHEEPRPGRRRQLDGRGHQGRGDHRR